MHHDLPSLIAGWLHDLAVALTPAALGSAVGQAWSKGLTWSQRLVQWLVGILVSFYVTRALADMLAWSDFAAQAAGFVIAMIAFETAPKFIAAAAAAAGQLPALMTEALRKWTR